MAKKIIVFYHKNCWDGFSGAWAAWKKLGNKADYVGVKPGEAPDFSVKGKDVYLIDTAFPAPAMKKFLKDNSKLVVLDHHVSNKEVVKISTERSYVMNHSGAVIAWNYFHPKKPVPVFLKYVEDVDIWKWKLPYTAEISAASEGVDQDFKVWSKLVAVIEDPKRRKVYITRGANMLEYSNRMMDTIMENAQVVKFAGHKCLAVNSPVLRSEIGHALVKKMPHVSIIWSDKGDRRAVSLRSDGKVDVSKLAQKYGGGGHKAAAAFRLSLKEKLPWKFLRPFEN